MIRGLVSVIVLAWNRYSYTRRTIESLQDTLPASREIIVVDNGSEDETRAWLNKQVSDGNIYACVFLKENTGASHGFNYGLRLARGDLLVVSDNDYEFARGWYEDCTRILGAVPEVGAVSPCDNRHVERQTPRSRDGVDYMEEPYNIVTCAMIRVEAMKATGLFPSYGALYGETDTLWCDALRKWGWKIACLKSPKAMHLDWAERNDCRLSNEAQQKKVRDGQRDLSLNWKFTL